MTYDPQKTKSLFPIIGAFSGQPGGEFIVELANQLRAAENEIRLAQSAASQSERDLNRVTAELESAQQSIMRLRNGASGYAEMLTALQTISKSSRGAQNIAVTALNAAIGSAEKQP